MADKTVTVEALQEHTAFGHAYKVGDVYEIDAEFLTSVIVQGKCKLASAPPPKAAPEPEKPKK